jgi:putative intracellular protease/amidase
MNKKVLVPIAHGTEEMEAVIIIDMLRRAGLNVKVAGETEIITCSRGVKLIPDVLIHKMEPNEEFDAIAIPGGLEGN